MEPKKYDITILGSGPAGLQSAIHASRAKISVLVLGRPPQSSLIKAHIENYCCLPAGATGEFLLHEGRKQAKKFGAEFLEEDATNISGQAPHFQIKTESGIELESKALILAMGISRDRLGVPGEKELLGKGVSYCVDCDANFFKGVPVAMIGGGSAAATGALTLLYYTPEVHLICDSLTVSDVLARQIRQSVLQLHEGKKVKKILGQKGVEGVELEDGSLLRVEGVFIELGAKGVIEMASKLGVALDTATMRYVVAGKKQETNIPGVYAAGDICGPPWQMAKAVGEGCVAGLEAVSFVKKYPA